MSLQTQLPIYHKSIDWDAFFAEYPVPDVFERTVYRWPRERLREFQNKRFMQLVKIGWKNEFYRRRWAAAGLQPGDIKYRARDGHLHPRADVFPGQWPLQPDRR